MISDAETAVSKIGNDEFECTGWNVQIRENGNNLVVRHSVESLAKINSSSNHSRRILGRVVKVLEDEIDHSDDVVYDGATGETTKLVKANMREDILPDPLDQELLHPLANEGSEPNAPEVILRLGDWDLVDGDSKLFLEGVWPLMRGEGHVDDGSYGSTEFRKKLIKNISRDITRHTAGLLGSK